MNCEKILIFGIAGREFAVDIRNIERILNNNIEATSNEDFIDGIIDYSNEVLKVINLTRVFKIEEIKGDSPLLIILSRNNEKIAIRVDSVLGIVEVNRDDIKEIPRLAFKENNFFKELIKFKDKLVIILEVKRILLLNS